jgi:hypothetical protein
MAEIERIDRGAEEARRCGFFRSPECPRVENTFRASRRRPPKALRALAERLGFDMTTP